MADSQTDQSPIEAINARVHDDDGAVLGGYIAAVQPRDPDSRDPVEDRIAIAIQTGDTTMTAVVNPSELMELVETVQANDN